MIEHDAGYLPLLKATCWCSAGYNVVIRDINQKQCDEALQYISENVASFATKATTGRSSGTVSTTLDLEDALQGAWILGKQEYVQLYC